MWDFFYIDFLHIKNIGNDWVTVWQWPAYLIFFYGMFLIFFVIAVILYPIIRKKSEFFTNRHLVTSLSLSVYSLVYSIWFTVFFSIFWVGGTKVRDIGFGPFRYDVGPWIILFIVLFPLLFFSFIGNTIWFAKLKKKLQTESS